MNKLIIFLMLLCLSLSGVAQNEINESYPLNNESKVAVRFEYPSLIKIQTWDKKEVLVKASVDIDGGEQNETFTIDASSERGTFYLKSKLKGLSKKYNYHFRSDGEEESDEVRIKDNGHTVIIGDEKSTYYKGVEIDIVVELFVPENMEMDIYAKFGMVEVLGIPNSLEVDSEFGGIDVALNTREIKALDASTSWGQIYSNLESKMDLRGGDELGKELTARLSSSGGKRLYLDTKFGNVYLRKN